jgi:hypothetical protein
MRTPARTIIAASVLAAAAACGSSGSTPASHATTGAAQSAIHVYRGADGSYETRIYGDSIASLNARTDDLCKHQNSMLYHAMVTAGLPSGSGAVLVFRLYHSNGQPFLNGPGTQTVNLCGVAP